MQISSILKAPEFSPVDHELHGLFEGDHGDFFPFSMVTVSILQVLVNGAAGCKRRREEMEGGAGAEAKGAECTLAALKGEGRERAREGAVFWPSGWRTKLCACASCKVRTPPPPVLNVWYSLHHTPPS